MPPIKNCTTVLVKPQECCYKTTSETVTGNQNINNVNFPVDPNIGDTHIVEFDDSLVIYEFGTEWTVKINNSDFEIINIPSTAFLNPLEPKTSELELWADSQLTDEQKRFSYLKYNYGDSRLTTLSGQIYLLKNSELTKLTEINPFRNGNILVLNIDVLNGSDTLQLHVYEDGANYLTLDKAMDDYIRYFDSAYVEFRIANSSIAVPARITTSKRFYNKNVTFGTLLPDTDIEVNIEAYVELRNCTWFMRDRGNWNFNGSGYFFTVDSYIDLYGTGSNINLPDTPNRVAFVMRGGGMAIGDTFTANPVPSNIVWRADNTKLLKAYAGETSLSIAGVNFINPSYLECKLVSGSDSNSGGTAGTVNITTHTVFLGNINSVSNVYWGGHAFIKVYEYDPANYIPACLITTGREQLLPLKEWSTACINKKYKTLKFICQEGVAFTLENDINIPFTVSYGSGLSINFTNPITNNVYLIEAFARTRGFYRVSAYGDINNTTSTNVIFTDSTAEIWEDSIVTINVYYNFIT